MQLKQLTSLQFLLKQGLAIRGHKKIDGNLSQLLLLRSKDCPEWVLEKRYLSINRKRANFDYGFEFGEATFERH